MNAIDYWKFASELSVVQAALLTLDVDPSGEQEYIDLKTSQNKPAGYDALLTALRNDILSKRLPANLGYDAEVRSTFHVNPEDYLNWHKTTISVDDLKCWLKNKGIKDCFFFSQADVDAHAPYLDKQHPHYAPKLAAAVEAWMAVVEAKEFMDSGTPKKHLDKWLRENAARYGLSDQDGNPNNTAIEEISKIANWNPVGGAGKTPIKSGSKKNPTTPEKDQTNKGEEATFDGDTPF